VTTAHDGVGEANNLAALNNLAAELSASVSLRDRDHEQPREPEVVTPWSPAPVARGPRVAAAVLTLVLVVAVAGSLVLLVKTLHTGPVRAASATVVPQASTTLARQLGVAARQRLVAGGETPGAAQCQKAYAADAAASPLVLPAVPSSRQRSAFVAGCVANR
jgi:hypothetical protein